FGYSAEFSVVERVARESDRRSARYDIDHEVWIVGFEFDGCTGFGDEFLRREAADTHPRDRRRDAPEKLVHCGKRIRPGFADMIDRHDAATGWRREILVEQRPKVVDADALIRHRFFDD